MNKIGHDEIRQAVRQQYGKVAVSEGCSCDPSCCGTTSPEAVSRSLGYSADEVAAVPAGSNLGLGCGNPQAIADLKPGETVIDLGSGAGFDCFLAARQIGNSGHVIGVDMTPEMVSKARANAATAGCGNVEFRLGEIEHLPVADGAADVIISNCVINLSPDKSRVFRDCFRVLKPGGRLAISDVVAFADIPAHIQEDMTLLTGCMAGASPIHELEETLAAAGFQHIRIAPKEETKSFIREWAPGTPVTDYVVAATIEAVKPVA
jgi:ubiquinone/menaquinone biosynthesis C-methylase UbiE